MPFSHIEDEANALRPRLATMRTRLARAIERFRRDLREYVAAAVGRTPRPRDGRSTRLPPPRAGRPVMRGLALPRRPRSVRPMTVLERRRLIEARRRGGPPAIVEAVEGNAQRVADAVRRGLLAVQRQLRAVYWRNRAVSRMATALTRMR